jgi:hypothetical protein
VKWWVWLLFGGLAVWLIFSTVLNGRELVIPDDDDVEALARMIASEDPNASLIVQQGIAWAAKNEADRRGLSVFDLLEPNGNPGPQTGRYASTVNPSTQITRSIAYDVLSGKTDDPTRGSIQFDNPGTQDKLYAAGKVSKDADDVAAERQSDGKEMVTLPGVPATSIRFWRYA